MFLLCFGVLALLAGVFTAYFGSGKSRGIGAGLLVIGLVVLFLFAWFVGLLGNMLGDPLYDLTDRAWNLIKHAIVGIIGGIIGALVAIGLFLIAIMKS